MKFWKLFAICPFWHRKRKPAFTAPRSISYREPAPPHGATSTPFHGAERIPPHSATPAPFHNTAPVPLHGAEHVSTHGAVPVPFHSDQPAPSCDAAASLPCPGTVQEPRHGGKPIHPQHRAMVVTRAASQRFTIAPKPRHLTASRQVRLAPPPALLQSCWEPENKKLACTATFLRLRIAAEPPIAN